MSNIRNKMKNVIHRLTGSKAVEYKLENFENRTSKELQSLKNFIKETNVSTVAQSKSEINKEVQALRDFVKELTLETSAQNELVKSWVNSTKEKIAREMQVKEINTKSKDKMKSVYERNKKKEAALSLNDKKERYKPLTPEELKEINDFWAPYSFAYKNNPEIQWFYSRLTGKFDPSYVDYGLYMDGVWQFKSRPLPNPLDLRLYHLVSNKILNQWLFKDIENVKMPRAYVYAAWGTFQDENRNHISRQESIDICYNILRQEGEEIIVKDTLGEEGNNIDFLENGASKEEISDVFNRHKDFLCQQVIKNHPSYITHTGALNTIRIVTMLYKDEYRWVGSAFTMSTGRRVSNRQQEGCLACSVNEQGICGDYAISKSADIYHVLPNGFEFAGKKLYNYEAAQELAFKLHRKMPFYKYIGWDIAIDEAGEPVLIEGNTGSSSDFIQSLGYHAFINKEIAKEIYDECLIRTFYYNKANFDWNYREFSDHISLSKYCGFDNIVNVPDNIDGKKVMWIYTGAINDMRIEEVNISSDINIQEKSIANHIKVHHY